MLKPQDLLVVLKFAASDTADSSTYKRLAESLFMSASEVFESTRRAIVSRLLLEYAPLAKGVARYRVSAPNLHEFLTGGLRYIFPGVLGSVTRGFRTAYSAPPLDAQLASPEDDLPVVWPHHRGDTRGLALEPIYRTVVEAALQDRRLYTWVVLVDALRLGDARIRSTAAVEVSKLTAEITHGQHR